MAREPNPSTIPPSSHARPPFRRDFEIAIVCALPLEYDAAVLLIDEFWDLNNNQYGRADGDKNTYRNGRIGRHNVVLMLLPSMGTATVAGSAASLRTSYPAIQIAFLVGICGGSPNTQDAFLGDVVISDGVIQYLLGRQYPGVFVTKGMSEGNVHTPNKEIQSLIAYFKTEPGMVDLREDSLKHLKLLQNAAVKRRYKASYKYPGTTEDKLFAGSYSHKHRDSSFPCNVCAQKEGLCDDAAQSSCSDLGCDDLYLVQRAQIASEFDSVSGDRSPEIFIGRIGSGDTVMKSGEHRDKVAKRHNIIAFEMEGAGIWNELPTVVIKGICDYSDSHKTKLWQPYAAAAAAAVTKAVMERYSLNDNRLCTRAPVAAEEVGRTSSRIEPRQLQTAKPKEATINQTNALWTLENALQNFQLELDEYQCQELKEIRTVPDADAVLVLTAHLDSRSRDRKGQAVSSRLFPILQTAQEFCEIAGMSHSKLPLLVWGSVKMTALVISQYIMCYHTFSEIFLDIGRLCPSSQQYRRLYPTSSLVRNSVYTYFVSLLEFCKEAIRIVKRTKEYISSSQNSILRELTHPINNIRRCSATLQQDLITATALEDGNLKDHHQKKPSEDSYSTKILKWASIKSKERDNEVRVAKHRQKVKTQELLESLSSHDFLTPLMQSRRKRQRGTGEWLFRTREFKKWVDGDAAPVLWCSGKIGSGKTILMTSVIDYILTEKRSPDTFVSFFFVQFDSHQSLHSATIIRSIIRQVLNQAGISDQERSTLDQLDNKFEPNLHELIAFLHMIIMRVKKVYILIDGLDECEKSDRDELLEALSSLVRADSKVLIFLAGRTSVYDQIKRSFPHQFYQISTAAATQIEIATYIDVEIEEKLRREDLNVGDLGLVKEVKSALKNGADGMFLWVAFQIKELCSCHCDDEIRKVIRNLPKDLPETFNRALRRIVSRNQTEIALTCFRWVAAVRRPLTLQELREALSIQICQEHTMKERLPNDIHRVSSWCENLVVLDEEENLVQFAHHTILEFLTTKDHQPKLEIFHFDLEDADYFVGEICVTYLSFSDFKTSLMQLPQPCRANRLPNPESLPRILPSDIARGALGHSWSSRIPSHALRKFFSKPDTKQSVFDLVGRLITLEEDSIEITTTLQQQHPFLEYASNHWLYHTKNFHNGISKSWNLWQNLVFHGHDLAWRPWATKELSLLFSENAPDPETLDYSIPDLKMENPLEWAFRNNHHALISVAFKLNPGLADAHETEIWRLFSESIKTQNTRLFDCILLGIVRFKDLLSVSIDDGYNSLQIASRAGNAEMVKRLLSAGAYVNYQRYESALHLAVGNGHLEVTDILIKSGASINSGFDIEAGKPTVLHLAAREGYLALAETLLASGADMNARSLKDGCTPLHMACEKGRHEIVELLIKSRARLNCLAVREGKEMTEMDLADLNGYQQIVDFLGGSGGVRASQLPKVRALNVRPVFKQGSTTKKPGLRRIIATSGQNAAPTHPERTVED